MWLLDLLWKGAGPIHRLVKTLQLFHYLGWLPLGLVGDLQSIVEL